MDISPDGEMLATGSGITFDEYSTDPSAGYGAVTLLDFETGSAARGNASITPHRWANRDALLSISRRAAHSTSNQCL